MIVFVLTLFSFLYGIAFWGGFNRSDMLMDSKIIILVHMLSRSVRSRVQVMKICICLLQIRKNNICFFRRCTYMSCIIFLVYIYLRVIDWQFFFYFKDITLGKWKLKCFKFDNNDLRLTTKLDNIKDYPL